MERERPAHRRPPVSDQAHVVPFACVPCSSLVDQAVDGVDIGERTRFENVGADAASGYGHVVLMQYDLHFAQRIFALRDGADRIIFQLHFFFGRLVDRIVNRIDRAISFRAFFAYFAFRFPDLHRRLGHGLIAVRKLDAFEREYFRRLHEPIFDHSADILIADRFFTVRQIFKLLESIVDLLIRQVVAEIDQLFAESVAAGMFT